MRPLDIELREVPAESMTPTRIHLEKKVDHLKGNWFEWSCTACMPDGKTVEGSVQADGQGEMIAEETFEEC